MSLLITAKRDAIIILNILSVNFITRLIPSAVIEVKKMETANF